MNKIILKAGREKSLLKRHPWIFSGAIKAIEGNISPGETVKVFTSKNEALALAAYSPQSQITARAWSFDPEEKIDEKFFVCKIKKALEFRKTTIKETDSFRVVNAENDGLPGLIVDKYSEWLVCEFLSAGAEYQKQAIVEALNDAIPNKGIFERSDNAVRKKEGLPETCGLLSGEEPPELIEIQEGKAKYFVDVRNGHKTGFYLDQRENRRAVYELGEKLGNVLNCFSYTGGFGIQALLAGAENLTNVDISEKALELCERNCDLNYLPQEKMQNIKADVFQELRTFRDKGLQFDTIILDPPKFAETKHHIHKASRAYKDINLLAMKLLKPGGNLFTFSCSGNIGVELFQKIVAGAAIDSGREIKVVKRLYQAPDHTESINFPEGLYLKGLHCQAF